VTDDRVRTVAAVVAPAPLAGSTVTVDEAPAQWRCQVRLPTMDRPREITGADQYAALPLADLGYLDLSVGSHPGLEPGEDGELRDDALGVVVREVFDDAGRCVSRSVDRPGTAGRVWISEFPDAGAPDASAPLRGSIRWGDDTAPTSFVRSFFLAVPPAGWSDPGSWSETDQRGAAVRLIDDLRRERG
jgi:hypothetical protein